MSSNEKIKREICEFESTGLKKCVINEKGRLAYQTESIQKENCCNQCDYLELESNPDPDDCFNDDAMKATCLNLNIVIGEYLSPSELANIHKPIYCPFLGRELTELEKEIVSIRLKHRNE